MKTLHFKNQEFQAEIIIKGEDYIKGVNLEGFQVFLFDGISDFSYFTLSPNEDWDAPIEPEKINATNVKLDPITGISAETVHQGIEKLVNNIKSTVKTVNNITPDEHGNVNVPKYLEFEYGVTSYNPIVVEAYAGNGNVGSQFQVFIGDGTMTHRIIDTDISIIPLGNHPNKAHRTNMNVSWERDESGNFINLFYTTDSEQFKKDDLGVFLYKETYASENGSYSKYYLTIEIRKPNKYIETSTVVAMVNRITIKGTQDTTATYNEIENFSGSIVTGMGVQGVWEKDFTLDKEYSIMEADKVSVTPINGLNSINVQDALEEVFLVSSEIIKTVADSLGYPFNESDGNTSLNNKLADMRTHFRDTLQFMNVDSLDIHSIEELIDRIKLIKIGIINHGEELHLTAPDSIGLQLDNEVEIDKTVATLFKKINSDLDKIIYFCQFYASDASKFLPNEALEFNNKLSIKKVNIRNMDDKGIVDVDGRDMNHYTFNPLEHGYTGLDRFKINDFKRLGVDWSRISMTSNSEPAPYKVSAKSSFSPYLPWTSFDGNADINNWLSSFLVGDNTIDSQWIEIEYPTVQQFNRLMVTCPTRDFNNMINQFTVNAYNETTNSWDEVYNSGRITDWSLGLTKRFSFDKTGVTKRFRINVKGNLGGSRCHLGKIVYGYEEV